MPRTPSEVATDLRQLIDEANTKFVPLDLVKAMRLTVEFAESTVAALAERDQAAPESTEPPQAA